MNEVRREILSWTVDDSYGLWELLAALTARLPEASDVEVRRVASLEIIEMMRDGLAELLLTSSLGVDESMLDLAEAKERMDDEEYWRSPLENAQELRVVATDRGRRVYYELRPPQ